MSALKRFLEPYLLMTKTTIGKRAKIAEVRKFVEALKPIETEHPLIRVGGEGDGGYLVPDDLAGIEFCFSPGVSSVADFENDLSLRGIKSFLVDASVAAPPLHNPMFDFERKFLGVTDDEPFITLDRWLATKVPASAGLLMQMDIEGSEYPVILNASPDVLRRFRIIVIEFHDLDGIFDRLKLKVIDATFAKLLRDFSVVHIHPNNNSKPLKYEDLEIPPLMEFTFLRKDRITRQKPARGFPHPLDRKNVPGYRDIKLPRCWHA
jgi:methyltransferase FkbM-like protein